MTPMVTDDRVARAEALLRASCGDRLRAAFALAPLTTFRIGGPAALYLEPESDDDLDAVAATVAATGIQVMVIGKGSNILVSDGGVHGLVLRLGRGYRWAARDGDIVTAGGSMPLPALAGVALRHGLAGLAFAVAIPATLGGAVRMNAGAHDGAMADVVTAVDVYRLSDPGRRRREATAMGFEYRHAELPDDAIVVGAAIRLRPGQDREIRAAMDEAREWRRMTQPLAEPNCGSVFTNPPGDHAARLIDGAGLKGHRVGGARVSEKHANFIVAGPGATAADVVSLIGVIRDLVLDRSGVELTPEVRLIGEAADA